MDNFQYGAWVVHHTNKLQHYDSQGPFEKVFDAGKAGKLLSALSSSHDNAVIPIKKVEILAKTLRISNRELPTYLKDLEGRRFLDIRDDKTVQVYAVTSKAVLGHTANMFLESEPSKEEMASIDLAEKVSQKPTIEAEILEELADYHSLSSKEVKEVIDLSKRYTFTDHEKLRDGNNLLFNGNLFKKGDANKIQAVLSSLKNADTRLILEAGEMINGLGCVPYKAIHKILGQQLLEKLLSIGFYDVNTVANSTEEVNFITRPDSFAKYGNPLVDDGLDHAKRLVAAFTYGMNYSPYTRGQIRDISALVRKLVNGGTVGPVDAIGQDYQALERDGVVQIIPTIGNYGNSFSMKLLKKDVGEIALQVIKQGNASPEVALLGAKVSKYVDPEFNRTTMRLQQGAESKKQTQDALLILRTS